MLCNHETYFFLQKKMINKAIEELHYEEILMVQEKSEGYFILSLEGNVEYRFKGKYGVWGNVHITSGTLQKFISENEILNFNMNSFFKEIQTVCEMSDDTLSKFIEEGNQTLFSDLKVHENIESINMQDILKFSYAKIDQLLAGHPKLIMNKGRLGWGELDIQKFSPEFKTSFKLRWIAVKRDISISGFSKSVSNLSLIQESIDKKYLEGINILDFYILPVHPWQWDKYIKVQYYEKIVEGNILDLGEVGEEYFPQISIRTLSRQTPGAIYDIKQSLSILNTSCVRGIPQKYISCGHEISEFVEEIILTDEFLKEKVLVLKEVGAISVPNKNVENIIECSYRYKELLGVVWRQSVSTKLKQGENAIPTAALFCKNSKTSLISQLILTSGLKAKDWAQKYFEVIVVPLYALQIKHGLGLVSHGQNIILVHADGIPTRLIIKDFHGDLRISKTSIHLASKKLSQLDRLPAEHLIHDLITGHFISVLRYISRTLDDSKLLKEKDFYQILGRVILKYHNDTKLNIPENVNLLKDSFEKILVNKIRFIEGYNETGTRLKPKLGISIINPLKKYL